MVQTINLSHLLSDANDGPRKKEIKNTDKYAKKRLVKMLKYFVLHTSLHGIKYTKDKRLYRIERIFWGLLCIVALCCCSKLIFQLYERFQLEHTRIYIDDVSYGINEIDFPSVTICPGTIIDWDKAIHVVDNLTRSQIIPQNSTSKLLDILKEISKLRFVRLSDLKIDVNESILDSLKNVDLGQLLYSAMPSCEDVLFNCSWSYDKKNCCEKFEVQKTPYGFCYAFNSRTFVNHKHRPNIDLLKSNNYGIRGGLVLTVSYDNIRFPPDAKNNETALFIISPPDMYPSKARKVRLGKKYNINVKFMCTFASQEVIDLENSNNPPCKHENDTYNYKKCLDACDFERVRRVCRCNPTFLYPKNASYRFCTVKDLECLTKQRQTIDTLSYFQNFYETDEPTCNCARDCKYCYYDDHIIGFDHSEKAIVIDVHYDGPTGMRYRRDLVASDLDLLVQLGGIFGLFLGGSLITLTEFVYFCLIGSIFSIYQFFNTLRNKRNRKGRPEGLIIINVMQYSENGNRHLMDFSIKLKK